MFPKVVFDLLPNLQCSRFPRGNKKAGVCVCVCFFFTQKNSQLGTLGRGFLEIFVGGFVLLHISQMLAMHKKKLPNKCSQMSPEKGNKFKGRHQLMICLRNKLGKRFGPDIFLRFIGDFMGVVSPI